MNNWNLLGSQRHYGNVSMTLHSLPTIHELREQLGIQPLNTGRQIYPFGMAGIVTDDMEGLHAVSDEHGRTQLTSGTEFSMQVYRGQTQEYKSCLPSLGRAKTPEEQLLALCRNIAFEDALAEHPFVRLAEQSAFLGNSLFIDKEGLAQHYGLPTHMLDVSSNFDVASFFAACAWNSDKGWEPVTEAKHHGIIYRLTPSAIDPSGDLGNFHIVGWQPLPRPEQQRASALRMKSGQDFKEIPSVECFRFRHRARVSVRIWKAFDEGRELFPADAAAELATQAEALQQFTRAQIDRAWARLEKWTETSFLAEKRLVAEGSCNLFEVASPILSWAGLDVETDEDHLLEKLQEVFNRVRYRMTASHFCDSEMK
ncbi:MAG: FRG domain-containing protein [Gallionellaceae bacterium]